jgi:hypothetical protein
MTELHVLRVGSTATGRLVRILATGLVLVLSFSGAMAQEGQRPTSERGTTRQTVQPGEAPSSRRQPSRIRNAEEPPPTVQNRAPEVMIRTPPTLPPAQGAGGN